MNKIKSIKFNASIYGIRRILNLLFPLITFPYISHVLSVDEIGKYNFSYSVVSYFLLISALGFDKYAVREGSKYRDEREKLGEFVSQVFSLNIVATVTAYVLLFVLMGMSQKLHSYSVCILIFSMEIFFTTLGTEWLYSIFEEYTYITISSIVFKLISIALLFVFVRDSGDYLKYAGITVFASAGSNVLNFINARKYCDIKLTFRFDWKEILKPALIIFASNVAIQIYASSDITMLGYLKNDSVVGIYSISSKIYSIIRSVLSSILIVTIPRLAFFAGKKMREQYNALFEKIANYLLTITIPAMAGLVMLRVDIIKIIAGEKYLSAAPSLYILCFAIIFGIYSTLFNQCVLLPYKREKSTLISSSVSAALNIGLNFIFIPYMSEIGTAITTLLSEFTMAIMNYLACRDIIKNLIFTPKNIRNVISVFIGTAAITVICLIGCRCINNMWIEMLVCVVVSVITYGFILMLFKNPVVYEILRFVHILTDKAH